MKKILIITILLSSLFLFNFIFATATSRPFSVPCLFEGEVISFKEITKTDSPEEFKLTIKVTSHQSPEPQDYFYDESKEDLERACSFLENATISGSWYTPGQPYTKGQPDIDKTKVLVNGSIINGEIDTYDHIIKNISLIKAGLLEDVDAVGEEPEEVVVDEDVTAEDLGVSEQKTLPNSPFYFLKSFWRNLRLTFTFNSVNKAELRLRFANEMLIEARRLAEETDNQELFQRAIDKYQRQMEKLQTRIEKIQAKSEDNPKADAFLNRFNRKTELHARLMEKLGEKLENPQSQERVMEAKQRTIQHLNQVEERLIEKFKNRQRNCENLCGDGTCQEIVCLAIGCPCPETPTTCPEDCK